MEVTALANKGETVSSHRRCDTNGNMELRAAIQSDDVHFTLATMSSDQLNVEDTLKIAIPDFGKIAVFDAR